MSSRWLCRYGPYGPPTSGPSSQSRPSHRRDSVAAWMCSAVTLDRSVSSIRNTKVPPWCRANAQSYSAVRMLPTCRSPLGEGAKRTRTGRSGGLGLSATGDHPVPESADAFDGDGDLVADGDGSHACRGAGEEHVARQQGHDRADEHDQVGDVTDHLSGSACLAQVAVDRARD